MTEIDIPNHDWRKEHPPAIQVRQSKKDLLKSIAQRFLELAVSSQKTRGRFSVIMGGGRTPGELNRRIIEDSSLYPIDWNGIDIFFSDERCVPPHHADSNYKLILETLIQPLNIPRGNVARILGEVNPGKAAADYHEKLSLLGFGMPGSTPVFDLALLGMGPDGHTASLFPHSNALKEFKYFAAPAGAGPEGWERVTVTFPVFNAARHVWLMAAGAEKSQAVEQLVKGNYDPGQCPAQGIFPKNGNLIYWLASTSAHFT